MPMIFPALTTLLELGRRLWQGAVHVIYPPVCRFCDIGLNDDRALCESCEEELVGTPGPYCFRCGSAVGLYTPVDTGCSRCRKERFRFDSVTRLGPYGGRLRQAILRMKHAAGEDLAEAVGALWARHAVERLRTLAIDAVVPVPLHWFRRFRRGYNQSAILADSVARALGVSCRPRWLRRVRNTLLQTGQSATARRENVRNAFRARSRPALRGRTILLVDDVMTTGSTCHEAARALKLAGAARVHAAVLAHSES